MAQIQERTLCWRPLNTFMADEKFDLGSFQFTVQALCFTSLEITRPPYIIVNPPGNHSVQQRLVTHWPTLCHNQGTLWSCSLFCKSCRTSYSGLHSRWDYTKDWFATVHHGIACANKLAQAELFLLSHIQWPGSYTPVDLSHDSFNITNEYHRSWQLKHCGLYPNSFSVVEIGEGAFAHQRGYSGNYMSKRHVE